MKQLIFILLAMIGVSQAQTIQYIGAPTTTVISRGNFRTDSIFYLPKRSKAPTDTAALRYQISDSSLYAWTGSQWRKVGGDPDSLIFSTRAWRQKGDDSLDARINLKVNISDTASMLAPYLRKADTTAMLLPYIRHAGYGLTKSGQSLLVDTLNIATRAWRQKGLDSLAALEVSGSGTTNYVPKFTAGTTIGNSQIFDNGSSVGIGTITPQSYTGYKVIEIEGITGGAFRLKNTAATGLLELATNSTETYFKNVSNTPITFGTNNTERLRIFANGRIGINTTTDAGYQLDINGTLRSVNGANFATTSGNVGIGTASPSAKMHVVGSATTLGVLRVENSQNRNDVNHGTINIVNTKSYALGNDMGIMFSAYRSDNTEIDPRASIAALVASSFGAHLTFSTRSGPGTSSEKMRITEDGELLINTTSDAGDYKLQVAGNIYNTGSAVLAATGGEVLVGTTTDAGDYKLQVVGNARIGTGKLDIASNTVYGLGVARSGTSEVAGQIYNSNGILYFGAESSTGGGIFSGSSAYAGVIGTGANYPLQFAVNNITRGGFSTSGNLLLGFTTDSYFLKLQVNGSIFSNNQFFGQGANAQLSIDSSTNISPLYVSAHSLTGTSAQAMLYSNTTWNTTGNPSLLDLNVTNTASGATSNYIKITDGTNTFRVTKAAEVVTAAPTGGSIRKWKLGEAATVSPTSPNRTIRVEIDGTVYYLHAKTTND